MDTGHTICTDSSSATGSSTSLLQQQSTTIIVGSTLNNNNNNNNNNEDDQNKNHSNNSNMLIDNNNDEFNDIYNDLDNNNSNNNYNNMDDDDDNDNILDLQMTIVAMQTEHDIHIQKIQKDYKQQVRFLQEELRRLQNETNLLRISNNNNNNNHNNHLSKGSSNNTSTTQQQQQQQLHSKRYPGSSLFARSNAMLQHQPPHEDISLSVPNINSTTMPSQHHQQQQQHHRPTSTNASEAPPITITTTENQQHHNARDNTEVQILNNRPTSSTTTTTIETGVRLVYQLIQQNKLKQHQQQGIQNSDNSSNKRDMKSTNSSNDHGTTNTDHSDNRGDTHSNLMIAIQLIQLISSSSTSNLSEWDIIHYFIIEIIQQINVITSTFNITTISSSTSSTRTTTKSATDTNLIHSTQQLEQKHHTNVSYLLILLQWFYDALTYSHSSCEYIVQQLHENNCNTTTRTTTTVATFSNDQNINNENSNNTMTTASNNIKRKHRTCSISFSNRNINKVSNDGDELSKDHHEIKERYRSIEEQLSNSLLTTNNQQYQCINKQNTNYNLVQRLLVGIQQWYNVVNINNERKINTHTSITNEIMDISIISIKISSLLVSYCHDLHLHDGINTTLSTTTTLICTLDSCDKLLINFIHIATHVLIQEEQQQHYSPIPLHDSVSAATSNSSNRSKVYHSRKTTSNVQQDVTEENNIDNTTTTFNTTTYDDISLSIPLRLVHLEYIQQNDDNKNGTSNDKNNHIAIPYNVDQCMIWMTETLQLLNNVIWTKQLNKQYILSQLECTWIESKRTGSLMGIILDVLEYKIIPNIQLYSHPFTMSCVLWLHRLIDQPLFSPLLLLSQRENGTNGNIYNHTTTTTNNYYWRLLRTQNSTNDSTAEIWHVGPTAINILVQIFVRIVLQQMNHQHYHKSMDETTLNVSLIPLRDQIIRFMHSVLLHVQQDRQIWEREHYEYKKLKASTANTKKNYNTTKQSMRPILSFTTILTQQVEIYKGAIVTLLSIPTESSTGSCGNIYNSYLTINDDLRSMLRLQLDEIIDDQNEKVQH